MSDEKPKRKVWAIIHPTDDEEEDLALCGFFEDEDINPQEPYMMVGVIPSAPTGGRGEPQPIPNTLDILIMRRSTPVARFRLNKQFAESIFGRIYKWPRNGFSLMEIPEERFEARRKSMPTFSRF